MDEHDLTVTSQFDDVKKLTAEEHLRVMPRRSNLAVRFVPIGVIPIADLHRRSGEAYLMSHNSSDDSLNKGKQMK